MPDMNEKSAKKVGNSKNITTNENRDIVILERLIALLFNNLYPDGLEFHYSGKAFPQFDINAKGRDIKINLHNLEFEQLLKLWKIDVTYKGKGIIEMGRGIKGIKINYLSAFFAILSYKIRMLFSIKPKRESSI
ncbi:MAG: hypothetical protein QXT63_07245 [Thermoplasmata archaeon]